jgi:hypothetical protein
MPFKDRSLWSSHNELVCEHHRLSWDAQRGRPQPGVGLADHTASPPSRP